MVFISDAMLSIDVGECTDIRLETEVEIVDVLDYPVILSGLAFLNIWELPVGESILVVVILHGQSP